jgi:hypothetical protein
LSISFWRRWLKLYLPELTRRNKWHKPARTVQIGDVVVIFDDNHPRSYWKKGLVTEIHEGVDGIVRTVTLKTANGILKRPVAKIAVLDLKEVSEE